MAFGRNEWKTGVFHMIVDLQKTQDYSYDLKRLLNKVKGCRIEVTLNTPLTDSEHADLVQEIRHLIAFVPGRVMLNGTRANKDVSKVKWTHEDDIAYYLVNPQDSSGQGVALYNLGAFVQELPRHRFGASGMVVTKKALTLNSARTEVLMSQDKYIWELQKTIQRTVIQAYGTATGRGLTDSDRRVLCEAVVNAFEMESSADFPEKLLGMKILRNGRDDLISFKDALKADHIAIYDRKYSEYVAPVHASGRALVLNAETCENLNFGANDYSVSMLKKVLRHLAERFPGSKAPEVALLGTYRRGLLGGYHSVEDKMVPKSSQVLWAMMRTLRAVQPALANAIASHRGGCDARTVGFGDSSGALAWTDGEKAITVSRVFMLDCALEGLSGMHRMLQVLIHEYCHDTADDESHNHDTVFFAAFHDLIAFRSQAWQFLSDQMYRFYIGALETGEDPLWTIPAYDANLHAPRCVVTAALVGTAAARKRELQNAAPVETQDDLSEKQTRVFSDLKNAFASFDLSKASSATASVPDVQRSLL